MKKEEVDMPAEIILGTINDADVVYINGTYIGETGYKYPPRFYKIPDGVLKEGINTVMRKKLGTKLVINICLALFLLRE